mgnify:CR=1 FL=1
MRGGKNHRQKHQTPRMGQAPAHLPRIEREMGVPIPGEILPQEKWVQTALKKLPTAGFLPVEEIFGRSAPLVVDLGCGNGRFSLGSAWSRKEMDHLAADILPVVIRYATRRGNQRGLSNLRFLVSEAHRLVRDLLPPNSTSEIHCYHPQPFDDPRWRSQRLITPLFMAHCIRALKPEGQFFIQTDHAGYWSVIREYASRFFLFNERIGRWNDSPKGRTRREIHSLKRGLPIYRGHGVVQPGMNWEKAKGIAEDMNSENSL